MATVTIADLPLLAGTLSDSAFFPIELNGITKKITATQLTSGRDLSVNNLNVSGGVNLGSVGTDTITLIGQVSANSSVGSAGQVLTSQGANLSPQWTTPTTGTVTSVTGQGTVNGITLTGTVTNSGYLTLGGTLSVNLTTDVTGILPVANGGTGVSSLPSGSLVGTTATQTLTNKTITQRVYSSTTETSPWAWNSGNYDVLAITALANNLTINADSGSPTNGQKVTFRIKDNGTARTLSWTTGATNSFRAIGVTLPTSTVANKTVYIGCLYNSADSRWDVIAIAQEA